MWSSDFKGRSEKLEREQRQRLERDRLKAEKERAEKERFAQKVRQHEEEVSRRRAALLAAEEIVRYSRSQISAVVQKICPCIYWHIMTLPGGTCSHSEGRYVTV